MKLCLQINREGLGPSQSYVELMGEWAGGKVEGMGGGYGMRTGIGM